MYQRWLITPIIVAIGLVAGGYLSAHRGLAVADSANDELHSLNPIAVSTVIAEKADFPIRRRSIGVMESPAVVIIRSRIDSQILEQHVKDGQIVRTGDLLFSLDDREVKAALARAEATLEKDLANKARADLDLNRMKQLLERNAAAKQQLDQATADAKAAAATVASDRAQVDTEKLRLSYTEIRAPISGRIGSVRVTPGNLVSANDMSGTGLVTITQVRPIRVSFTVPEKDLALVRNAYWRKLRRPGPPSGCCSLSPVSSLHRVP
ncbi:Multidrug resistance protein MdtA precursor [Methyloligella halotolerans]|uniref:Multidrug resistance protein MdtA n=1 Tax=Methyloligella halotolerans TaxID=1177755 RepID=A0A1E2RVH1_9HYPH|nr:efflux RND transporter periplasmic adaptor subunit [Methyloligella halotolerans]ODA66049.1 Multidrug resistance protein MdtA precursor [Methyloligella halotolerans]